MAAQLKEDPEEVVTSPYTVAEMWEHCPQGLRMEVFQELDIASCQRLTRVNPTWRDDLSMVPQANNGLLFLKIHTTKAQRRMEDTLLELCTGGECYCDLAYHSAKDASGVTITTVQRPTDQGVLDRERTWWRNLLGVTDLAVVRTLVIDTKFPSTARHIGVGFPTKTNSIHCLLKHATALSCIFIGQFDRFTAAPFTQRWVHINMYQRDPRTSTFVERFP